MRARIAAVFTFLAIPAHAAAPQDVLGYALGQPMAQALAVDRTRAAVPCGTRKCLVFDADYLGRKARIHVEIDPAQGVRRIAFNLSNAGQPDHPDCARLGGSVVAAAAKAYGRFDESDPGISYTWRSGAHRYKLTALCMPSPKHPPAGGIIGLFETVSAAP